MACMSNRGRQPPLPLSPQAIGAENERRKELMERAVRLKAEGTAVEQWRDCRWAWVQYVDMVPLPPPSLPY
jgi:hypothetical protein